MRSVYIRKLAKHISETEYTCSASAHKCHYEFTKSSITKSGENRIDKNFFY
jgi:hypothetical protein